MNRYFLLFFLLSSYFLSFSNNVSISNVLLVGQNTASDFTLVQFNISWDNSWRTSTLESNWDATWIFVKWRKKTQTFWNHATLNTLGHTAPSGSIITTPSDGKGVFIYKSGDGIGSNSWVNSRLRWNYGVDGLGDMDLVEIAVFAIEMVYVPQGAFYAGDGPSINLRGTLEAATGGSPLQLTSEGAITLGGGGVGSLGNNNALGQSVADDFGDGTSRTLPASFPKGYSAFYVMKYEVTQEQYAAFLNKLTYTQQGARTTSAPNSAAGTQALSNSYRNGIDIMISGVSTTTPAVYACNLDGDGNYNEPSDGQNIACNFLSWADLAAYLDWAALRPFTELEFEKACRGTLTAVVDEYGWGSTTLTGATGVTNSGSGSEVASNGTANCMYNNSAVAGPMRVGCFAGVGTGRVASGGSYYGILDLSGNLWERAITIGNATGRTFTGQSGDGNLSAAGNANTGNWPGTSATGAGWRGSGWVASNSFLRISDRTYASETDATRYNDAGGRGARTSP